MIGGRVFTQAREESLPVILDRLTKRTGIPALEGMEWSVLQEFNLIKSKAFIRLRGSSSTGSTFNDLFKKQVHDAAKAGIRAALAQMVTVPRGNHAVLDITKSGHEGACIAITPGTTDTWQVDQRCFSFEEYIASSAARDFMNGTQFGVAPVFSEADVRQIYQFFRIKADRLSDPADAAILTAEDKADDFIAGVAQFIKAVQDDPRTQSAWNDNITTDLQSTQRIANRTGGEQARDKALTHGTFPVTLRAFNDGYAPANGALLRMFRNAETSGSGVEAKKLPLTLPGGDVPPQWLDFKVGADLAGSNPPVEDPKNPVDVDATHADGQAHAVAFVIDLPERSVKEPNRQNNWNGFYYYILDRTQTSHAVPPAPDKPPFPLGSNLLLADAMCVDAPKLSTIQTANNDRVRVTVFNNSDQRLTDIVVCSDPRWCAHSRSGIAAHSVAPDD